MTALSSRKLQEKIIAQQGARKAFAEMNAKALSKHVSTLSALFGTNTSLAPDGTLTDHILNYASFLLETPDYHNQAIGVIKTVIMFSKQSENARGCDILLECAQKKIKGEDYAENLLRFVSRYCHEPEQENMANRLIKTLDAIRQKRRAASYPSAPHP